MLILYRIWRATAYFIKYRPYTFFRCYCKINKFQSSFRNILLREVSNSHYIPNVHKHKYIYKNIVADIVRGKLN
jgi:hypothetical protein